MIGATRQSRRPPARRLLACLAGGLCSIACLAQAATGSDAGHCPSLPVDSGISWQYEQGPDFGICRGIDVKGPSPKAQLFGLYIGFAPNFDPKGHKLAETGSVAGSRVQWYIDDVRLGAYSRRTVLKVHPAHGPEFQADVWIVAKDGVQFARAKSLLEEMRFRE